MRNIAGNASPRILAIDVLRGIAIFGMVLCATISWNSGLPVWMFHAQVPPPDYVFRPDIPGITWVDLVFPFFLFSMGAAFPFSLGRRIAKGQPVFMVALGLVKRWAILTAFSFILGNCTGLPWSGADAFTSDLFMIAAWGAMFLSLTRFSSENIRLGKTLNIIGVSLIITLVTTMQFLTGIPFSKEKSDVIILILAYVAFGGGIIWIATRNSIRARLAIMAITGAIKALVSYCPAAAEAMAALNIPDGGWIFRWEFMQYLIIVIAGSIVGDMISKRKGAGAQSGPGEKDIWPALLAAGTVIFQLWGLYTRHIAADLTVTAIAATLFIAVTGKRNDLWSDIVSFGYILLVTGVILDPVDGGIRKDHCKALSGCGQNPMVAYTVTNFITAPVFRLTCLMPAIDRLSSCSQATGFLRGLLMTLIMMAITVFFTRRKLFWRS